MNDPSDASRDARSAFLLSEQRSAHGVREEDRRLRARRRHEARWERRTIIAIDVVAAVICLLGVIAVVSAGGWFAYVGVPLCVLGAAFFVVLALREASLD